MEPIRKTAHSPPVGYVIDGQRYLTVAEGTRHVGHDLICEATLWNYAKAGQHPCGLALEVVRVPLMRTSPNKPRTDKQFRYLLREDRLDILKSLLQEYRTHRTGQLSDEEFAAMRDEAERRVRAVQPPSAIKL